MPQRWLSVSDIIFKLSDFCTIRRGVAAHPLFIFMSVLPLFVFFERNVLEVGYDLINFVF